MPFRPEPFVWTLRVPDPHAARSELQQLTAHLRDTLPGAASVLVTAQGGVMVLGTDGETQDLAELPFHLAEQLAHFFGVGCYALPGPGETGCPIQRGWRAGMKRLAVLLLLLASCAPATAQLQVTVPPSAAPCVQTATITPVLGVAVQHFLDGDHYDPIRKVF